MSPTQTRMHVLAVALGQGSLDEVEAVWKGLWDARTTRDLVAMYPKQMKAIVDFARMKARGDLTGGDAGYEEMVGKVIAGVAR